jgi:hypothetical protein
VSDQLGYERAIESFASAFLEAAGNEATAARLESQWYGQEPVLSSSIISSGPADGGLASGANLCGNKKVWVLYVNGINTTPFEADQEAFDLSKHLESLSSRWISANMKVDPWYNPSVAELIQRLSLCPHQAIFWNFFTWMPGLTALGLAGMSPIEIAREIESRVAALEALPEQFSACRQRNPGNNIARALDVIVEVVPEIMRAYLPDAMLPNWGGRGPLQLRDRIRTLLQWPDSRVLVVAHSQGNYYTQIALENLDSQYISRVGWVAVGSPIVPQANFGSDTLGSVSTVMLAGDILELKRGSPPANIRSPLSDLVDNSDFQVAFERALGGPRMIALPSAAWLASGVALHKWALMTAAHGLQSGYLAYPSSRNFLLSAILDAVEELGGSSDGFWSRAENDAGPIHRIVWDDGYPSLLAYSDGPLRHVAVAGTSGVHVVNDGMQQTEPAEWSLYPGVRATYSHGLVRVVGTPAGGTTFKYSGMPPFTINGSAGLLWGIDGEDNIVFMEPAWMPECLGNIRFWVGAASSDVCIPSGMHIVASHVDGEGDGQMTVILASGNGQLQLGTVSRTGLALGPVLPPLSLHEYLQDFRSSRGGAILFYQSSLGALPVNARLVRESVSPPISIPLGAHWMTNAIATGGGTFTYGSADPSQRKIIVFNSYSFGASSSNTVEFQCPNEHWDEYQMSYNRECQIVGIVFKGTVDGVPGIYLREVRLHSRQSAEFYLSSSAPVLVKDLRSNEFFWAGSVRIAPAGRDRGRWVIAHGALTLSPNARTSIHLYW